MIRMLEAREEAIGALLPVELEGGGKVSGRWESRLLLPAGGRCHQAAR